MPATTAEKAAEAEQRKALREMIFAAVQNNILCAAESSLTEYRGFLVVLPANMRKEKPFVWLQRGGRYYVELGEADVGVLIRIDNFLDGFEAHIKKLRKNLDNLADREKHIRAELVSKESYSDKINDLKAQLEKIDKKLGVDKQ